MNTNLPRTKSPIKNDCCCLYLTDWTDDLRHGVNKITPTTSYFLGFGCLDAYQLLSCINFGCGWLPNLQGHITCIAFWQVDTKRSTTVLFLGIHFSLLRWMEPRKFCQWNGHVWRRVRYLLRQIGIACEPPPDGVIHCKYIIGELLVSTVKCVSRDSNTSIRYI